MIDAADDFEEKVSCYEIADASGETGTWLVGAKIPVDLRKKYRVYSCRSAATLLAESHLEEFACGERPKWAIWGNQAGETCAPMWKTDAYNSVIAAK